jgi:hypothetical protein
MDSTTFIDDQRQGHDLGPSDMATIVGIVTFCQVGISYDLLI